MLRWILVAIIVVLLTVTVFMFVERFGDDAEPIVATAPETVPAPQPSTPDAPAPETPAPETPTPGPAASPQQEDGTTTAPTSAVPGPAEPIERAFPPPAPAPSSSGVVAAETVSQGVRQPSRAVQPAAANSFSLSKPVECHIGRDCFVQQFVDIDPGADALDFTCGPLSYNDHTGVDIRLRNEAMMRAGIAVVAARDGIVVATRDGMQDIDVTRIGRETVRGRDCGNAVFIDHGDDWQTRYCHMRQGSVAVSKGQVVKVGQKLGLVGMSGAAQFPHLHIGVSRNNQNIDPFRGLNPVAACGGDYVTLWDTQAAGELAYQPGGILDAGLLDRQLTIDEAYDGDLPRDMLNRKGQALVIWYTIFGIRQGDEVSVSIIGPDGNAVSSQKMSPHPKNQAQWFAFSGRRTPPDGFAPGVYRGEVGVVRNGTLYDRRQVSATLR